MSYNGAGTFVVNSSGQPVVTGTTISSTVFNALTADLATALSTCVLKDGTQATTARVPFLFGISSTLTTDSTSISTGSIITSGGVGITKALWVGGLANIAGAVTMQSSLSLTSTFNVSGVINATLATDSTSISTGAIILSGGMGITKALWVGGLTNIAGAVTLQSTLAVTGTSTLGAVNCGTLTPSLFVYTFGGHTGTVDPGAVSAMNFVDGLLGSVS